MGLYGPGDIVEWFGSNIRKCDMGTFNGQGAGQLPDQYRPLHR